MKKHTLYRELALFRKVDIKLLDSFCLDRWTMTLYKITASDNDGLGVGTSLLEQAKRQWKWNLKWKWIRSEETTVTSPSGRSTVCSSEPVLSFDIGTDYAGVRILQKEVIQ